MVSTRKYSSVHKNLNRSAERDIGPIPAVYNLRRRRRCGRDWELYCLTYFPEQFTHPFTKDQRDIGNAIMTGIGEGGQRAMAAPRGTGKSTIAEALLTFAVNYGLLKFPLLIGANGLFAEERLAGIRLLYERSEKLAEDFPEICYPVSRLEGAAQRAKMQTCEGSRTRLVWGKGMIIMPTTPGSQSSGAIICCKGIEGAIRGLKVNGMRPDFCLLDDLTRGSRLTARLRRKSERKPSSRT